MSIDIDKETLVPLANGRKLPGKPSQETLERWAKVGVKGKSGQQIVLEVAKIGGVPYTSEEAFKRFAKATTADSSYNVEA